MSYPGAGSYGDGGSPREHDTISLSGGEPRGTIMRESISTGQVGSRLATMVTDAQGQFMLEYADPVTGRRPDLWLVVRAPEDMDGSSDTSVLHASREPRRAAGPTENYVIRISNQRLAAAGIAAPTDNPLRVEEPEAVVAKVSLGVDRQARINQDVLGIAAQQVATERARVDELQAAVESRLLEKLTGVPDQHADRLNYVKPGGDVEGAMYRAIKKSIDGPINARPPAQGFLILTTEQAQQFKNPDGTYRDNIPPAELEPYLFGSAESGERRTFLVREDPSELLRAEREKPDLFDRPPVPAPARGVARVAEEDPTQPPPTLDSIPGFVGRQLETMTSPEEAVTYGVKPRATRDEVQGAVNEFELHSGPADVPAFYDFHSLQIAYDYVWQKAIDEHVLDGVGVLSRQLVDLGGDPVGALSNGHNPITALRRELRTVQTAHQAVNLTPMLPAAARGFTAMGSSWEAAPLAAGGGPIWTSGGTWETAPPPTKDGVFGNAGGTWEVKPLPGWWPPKGGIWDGTLTPTDLLSHVESLLSQRYAFEIFAPGSVNFGILVTYRQRWAPISYQVGDLVKTLTLTPKETRKIATKRVIKKDRGVKEMEDSLRIRKEEASNTSRDEAEIVAKAETKTNFSMTAKGSYDIGIADGDSTVVFGRDAASTSSDTKKAFREAVLKAAQEYKDERKLEVETKVSYEEEISETSEITNPNDELPVTYLFYELQRRFNISERIHRLMPVVLVAMDVPNPSRSAIDALLLTHGWIIDRVLLDDQFRKPLDYMRTRLVGEEFAMNQMEQNLRVMNGVVEELKKSYTQTRTLVNQTADLLNAQMVVRANAADEANEGLWEKASEWLTGDSDSATDIEAARILEDAARERYERAVGQEKALRAQLESETAALKTASDAYARAKAEFLNCQMDLGTLRLHIKENILYYMQAVWSHTFEDQIFLSLHKKKVPRLATQQHSYRLSPTDPPSSVTVKPGQVVLAVEANVKFSSDLDPERDFVTLVEVADLDRLLGFKGNYMIFPLRESNALTDFMMTPFVDSELGLRDPDEFGNWTPEEFVKYAHTLNEQMQERLEKGEITQEEVEATIAKLTEQYKRLLSAPRPAEDEVTVPTGSLYIEALPGAHPILEDFKLIHRAIDVKRVQAEVRKLETETIRYAARILAQEREDPEIEKRIIIEGQLP